MREHLPPRELLQLVLVAGRRRRGRAHVVAQVQMRVVDPFGAALLERHECEPLAVAGHEVRRCSIASSRSSGGRGPLEKHHGGDVHVEAASSDAGRSVERGQAIRGHAPKLARSVSAQSERLI